MTARRKDMPNICENSLRIYANDCVQLYKFLGHINVPGYCDNFRRFEEDFGSNEIFTLVEFDTANSPPYLMYIALNQIRQLPEFEGLTFDATFCKETEDFTVLYRWVPGKDEPEVVNGCAGPDCGLAADDFQLVCTECGD
jgi:hypothetical protein